MCHSWMNVANLWNFCNWCLNAWLSYLIVTRKKIINLDIFWQVFFLPALKAIQLDPFTFWLQWPPFVEVVDTWELPPVLTERYDAAGGEGTALCGIFPEIRRAWAAVDNSLFLWRFDKWWELWCWLHFLLDEQLYWRIIYILFCCKKILITECW